MRRGPLLLLAAAALAACSTASVVIKPGFDFSAVKRVAVVRFSDYPRRPGSGDIVTGAFEQGLLAAGYDVIERSRVDEVMRGKNVVGLDPKALRKLGQALGVDAFVAGQITDFREPREEMSFQDVVDTHNDPVYVRRRRQVSKDGQTSEVEESVLEGYRTTRVVRREPRTVTVDGRLGLSARLVHAADGQVLWSGSDVRRAFSLEESARDLAGAILDAVKSTFPKRN
jgi:hypothetical protein